MSTLPLAVDLDGTLVRADMLHESALRALRERPLEALCIPYWMLRGKAYVKQRLARLTEFDPTTLPYHGPLLGWLAEQRAAGRSLVLCTASDASIADAISQHLGLFDEVMASDGIVNLSGADKAEALEQRFGKHGFDYAGNERKDLRVWQRAHGAILVGATPALIDAARAVCDVEQVFPSARPDITTWRHTFRVHQWLKNMLLFVPLLAAHRAMDPATWFPLAMAFLAFSLCASTVYIGNDLFDLDGDRQHPRKRKRPFASGTLPIKVGVALMPVLLFASFVFTRATTPAFVAWLSLYLVLTCAYSWVLKRLVLLDCLTLAMLYTIRIVAGAAAVDMPLSFWLLAFAVFLFLSLAFVKRYAEIEANAPAGPRKIAGRGYYVTDAPLIQSLGITAGFGSVLVLALYLNSDAVVQIYQTPKIIWGTVPIMLFWVSWIWLKAHRGEMHVDPMVFAVRDKASLLCGVAFAAVLVAGTLRLS